MLLLVGLLILAVLVVSCAPGERGPVAGQAIKSRGAASAPAGVPVTCEETERTVFTKGTSILKQKDARGKDTILDQQTDSCVDARTIREFSCETRNAQKVIDKRDQACENGCVEGACQTCVPVAATACTAGVGCPGNTVIPADRPCVAGQECGNGVCFTTGPLAIGDPCAAHAQCRSGNCNITGSHLCAIPCVPLVATVCSVGQSCIGNAGDRSGVIPRLGCPAGQSCDEFGDRCAPIAPSCYSRPATACTAGVGCPGNSVIPATGCAAGQRCQQGQCAICEPRAATACFQGRSCPGFTIIPALGCPAGQECDRAGNDRCSPIAPSG